MGSLANNKARNDGSALRSEDIEDLKASIKGSVMTKASADEKEYNDAVDRWNRVYIKQPVRGRPDFVNYSCNGR